MALLPWSLSALSFLLCLCLASSKHVHGGGSNVLRPQSVSSDDDMKVICYYGSWSVYRPGKGKFEVEEIDPFLCSHIVYGFTGLGSDNRIRPLDPYNDLKDNWGKGAIERFTGLKQTNKKLKTLVAIGGWNEGSIKYSNMASNSESRAIFVKSVLEFLDRYGFDGLDMDWEYPASRGGKPEDKRNFVTLLRELKQAFTPKGYLLTAAVSAGKYFADPAYDIPQVSKYLDWIGVMAYDFHGGWEAKTGHNAPLYARPDEYGTDRILNVNYSINYWISNGAPRSKIVLGMGTYGRSFTLERAEVNGLNAPAPKKGRAGPYTREAGSLGYNEICELKSQNTKMTHVWDPYHLAPYAYWDRQWVGYDNVESVIIKSRFARAMGLAGGMVWSLETDDFLGLCENGKYPLLNAIKSTFQSEKVPALPLPNHNGPPTVPSSTTSGTSRLPTTAATTTTTRKPTTTTRKPTTTTTRKPTTTSPRPLTTTQGSSSTLRPETEPTTSRPTTTSTEAARPSSTTINWWPHKSSTWWPQKTNTWWPQKPTGQPAAGSSEVWWSSTEASVRKETPSSNGEEMTPRSTTQPDKGEFVCQESGLYRNPSNCSKFIRCLETQVEGQFQHFYHNCPFKTVFNSVTKLCDWVDRVPECIHSVPKHYLRGTFQTNFQVVHPDEEPMV